MRDLLAPEVHPGWVGFRRAVALAGGLTWLSRVGQLGALYSQEALIVKAAHPVLSWPVPVVWAWWSLLMGGLVCVGLGWRVRAGAAALGLGLVAMRVGSPDYIFLYDQLLLWQTVALLFWPAAGGRGPGSPFGRYLLTLTYCGLYAGTGLSKLARTTSWLWGAPLSVWLVDSRFAGGELARQVSAMPWALAAMGSLTVIFEAGFAPALLNRWTRRIWLVLGVALHLGIFALMRVHTFSLVALAGYPLLLSAADARALAARIGRRAQ